LVQAVRSVDGKIGWGIFYPEIKLGKLIICLSLPLLLVQVDSERKRQYKLSVTDACMNSALKEIISYLMDEP
jgi:hypothetical protein